MEQVDSLSLWDISSLLYSIYHLKKVRRLVWKLNILPVWTSIRTHCIKTLFTAWNTLLSYQKKTFAACIKNFVYAIKDFIHCMAIYVYRTKCLYCIIVQMKELFRLFLDMFLLKFSFPAVPSISTAMGSAAVLYIVHLTFDTTLYSAESWESGSSHFSSSTFASVQSLRIWCFYLVWQGLLTTNFATQLQ